ncbi:MAG TPA: YihY/virulence factor BrkB family protein [Candidatus Dormibacteraeota bacterium]|nr:YihY/virulence factor BrkB family protein [Candidatus Dormibacteraeota bacterium]
MSGRIDGMGRLMDSVPGRVIRKFLEDQAPNWAALIAWNALFAMFPIVVFASSLLGIALRLFGEANNAVYKTIFTAIPGDTTELLKAVSGVKSQSGVLFIIGLVGLLWGGSALFGAMEQAFAVIYHTKPRDFIPQRLIAFGMVFLFTVLVGIAVATSALLPALKHIPGLPEFLYSGAAAFILQVLVGITAGFLLFGSMYYVIPNRKLEFRKIIPGALVAGVLFELITLLFPLYISLNNRINQYGKTFGLFFVLMTFFFLLGLITMIGVEVNSVIYPVPIDLPGKDAHAVAAPESGPEGERKTWAGGKPDVERDGVARNGGAPNGRRGIPARAALGLAVVASVVGVLLGRRSANSD